MLHVERNLLGLGFFVLGPGYRTFHFQTRCYQIRVPDPITKSGYQIQCYQVHGFDVIGLGVIGLDVIGLGVIGLDFIGLGVIGLGVIGLGVIGLGVTELSVTELSVAGLDLPIISLLGCISGCKRESGTMTYLLQGEDKLRQNADENPK